MLHIELFRERGIVVSVDGDCQVQTFDAMKVKEPGKTGVLWCIHYSICLPSLACDFFKLRGKEGRGNGESFAQFPIREGDYILADRGYSIAIGSQHVVVGGRVCHRAGGYWFARTWWSTPQVVEHLRLLTEWARAGLGDGKKQRKNVRSAGFVAWAVTLTSN